MTPPDTPQNARGATRWRPMDEAPRTGQTMWLREDGNAFMGFWMHCGWWIPWEKDLWPTKPEAWKPLDVSAPEGRDHGSSGAGSDVDCAEGKS